MDNDHNATLDQEPLENTERTEDQNPILDEGMEDLQAVSEQRLIGNIKYIDYLDPILNESTEEIIVIAERKSMENPDPRRLLQQQLAEEYEIQTKRWIGKIRPFISRILRRQAESEDNGDLPLSVDWDERKELIKAQKLVIRKERIAGLSERTKQVPKEMEERLAEISSDRMVTELYHVLNTNVRPAKKHFQRKSEEYHQYIKEVEQPKKFSHLDMNGPVKRYLLHRDISGGKETFPVPVYSDTPDQTFDAKEFAYTTINKLPEYGDFYAPWDWKEEEKFLICCDCTDGCMDAKKCRCRVMNEKFGNVEVLPDGRMIVSSKHEETILVSCGPKCRCIGRCEKSIYPHLPPTINKFEVFRRNDIIGFGVRTTTNIKEGAIVSEFVGEVLSKDSLDQRKDDPGHENYSLLLVNDEELDLFEKLGIREAAVESTESDLQQQKVYVDPFRFGGFSRYFSHGCYPNLSHIRIAVNDIRTPFLRIIMFANQPIVAGSELLFDYGDSHLVSSSNTKIKCQCNTILCRDEKKYLSTLDNAKRLVHFRKRIKTTREKQEEIILKAEFLLEHKRYISDFEAIHWKITNEKPLPKVDANDRLESDEEEDRNENNHPRARYLLPASLRNKLSTSTQEANILEMARKRLRASIDGTNPVDEDEEVPAKVKRNEDNWNQALKIMDRTREKHTSIKDNVQEEVHPSTSSDNANDLNSTLPLSSAETLNDENEDVVEEDVGERYFVEEYVEDVVEDDVVEEDFEEDDVVRNDIKEEIVEVDEEEMSYNAHDINVALPLSSAVTLNDENEVAVEEDVVVDEVVEEGVVGDNIAEEDHLEEDEAQMSYNADDTNLALPLSSAATLNDEDEEVVEEDVVGDEVAVEDHVKEDGVQTGYDAQDINVALPSSSAATLNDEDEDAVEVDVVGEEVVEEHVVEEDALEEGGVEEDDVEKNEEEMSYDAQDINVALPSSSAATLNDEDEVAVEEDVMGDNVAEEDVVEGNVVEEDGVQTGYNAHGINMALPSSSAATLNDENENAVEEDVVGDEVVEGNVVEEDDMEEDEVHTGLSERSASPLSALSTWEMEPIASELETEMDEDEHQEQNYQLPGSKSEMEINMEEDEHQEHNDQQPGSTSEMNMDMNEDDHQEHNHQFNYQNQHFQRNQVNERMSSRTWREPHSTRYYEYSSPPDSPPSSMPKSSYDRSTHGRYEAKTRRKSENSRDYGRINNQREPSLERDWDSDNDRPIYVRRETRHPQYRNSLPMPMYPSEHRRSMPMYPSEHRGSMPMYPSEHRRSVSMYPSEHRESMQMYPSEHRGSMQMYPSEHTRANHYSTTSAYHSREMDPRYNNSYPSYRNVQEENHPSTSRYHGYDRNVPMPHNPMENRPSTSRSNIYDRYFSAPYNPDESGPSNSRRPNLATILRAEVLDDTAEYHDETERFSSIPLSNRPYGTQSNTTERRRSDVRTRREEEELHRRHHGNYPSRDSSPEWDSDPRYAKRPISRGSQYRSSVPTRRSVHSSGYTRGSMHPSDHTRGSMHPSGYMRGSMHPSGYTRYDNEPTLPSTSTYRSREMDARHNNSYPSYRNVQEEFRASSSRSTDYRRNLPYNPKESRKNKYNSRHNSSSPEYDDDEDKDRYETGMSERSASEESGSASEVEDDDQHELSPPPPPPKKRFTHMATRGKAKVLPRRREESDVNRRPGWTQPSRESSPESDSDNKYSKSMRKAKISRAPRRKSAPTPKQEPMYPSEEECSESNEEDDVPPPPSKTRKNKQKLGPRRGPRVDGRRSSSTKVKQEPTDRAPRHKSVPKQEPLCSPEEAMCSDSEDDEASPSNDVTPSTTRSKKAKHGPRGRPRTSQSHQKIKVKQEPIERPRSRRSVDEASPLPQKVNVKQVPLDRNQRILKGSRQTRKGAQAKLSSTIAPEEEEEMSSDGEDCVPQRPVKKGRQVKRQPPMKNSKRRK